MLHRGQYLDACSKRPQKEPIGTGSYPINPCPSPRLLKRDLDCYRSLARQACNWAVVGVLIRSVEDKLQFL